MLDNKTGGAGGDPAADAGIATETGRGRLQEGVGDCCGMNPKGLSINYIVSEGGRRVRVIPPKTIY